MEPIPDVVPLPAPRLEGAVSLEQALHRRRTVRDFADAPLTLDQVAQLAWAAQGVTDPRGLRTAPSAGALYPLELYVAAGRVTGLPAGLYRYDPADHRLVRRSRADLRGAAAAAALGQDWIAGCGILVVLTGVDARTTGKYGERGLRYIDIEAGHAAQNLALQAEALGLGAALVGAFNDDRLSALLELPPGERPLYLVPVGTR